MITEAVGLQNRVLQYFHVIQLMNAFWKKKKLKLNSLIADAAASIKRITSLD